MHPDKNTLSIRLTEPVLPLRSIPERASHHDDDETLPPAVVRGLLTLKLAKSTKISSIELALQAKAVTHYVQGAGPTRIDVTEQYKVHSASTVVFKAGPARQVHRATSTRPTVQFLDGHTESGAHAAHLNRRDGERSSSRDPQAARVSRTFLPSDLEMDNGRISQQDQTSLYPAPPYPSPSGPHSFLSANLYPSVTGRSRSVASSSRIAEPLSSPVLSRSSLDTPCDSSTSSVRSIRDFALSRTSSIEEGPKGENEGHDNSLLGPANVAYYGLSRIRTGSSSHSSEQDRRGRSHSRFSLGKVVHVFETVTERMRSRSPRAASRPRLDEQEGRGRSMLKGKGKAKVSAHSVGRALPQFGVTEPSGPDDANKQSGDGWVMFPEGTYTYPIFFTVPNNLPPTMKADRGSLTWKIKAEVKRPGALRSKMTAQKEVIVVCVPMDYESEAEGIDLQRDWDGQFQYRVQIAGRGVPVGGKIPFQLTITPLTKIKVHCIMVHLDERTEYYTRAGSKVGSDAIRRATLLVIRNDNSNQRYSEPILPLVSNEPDAFRKSPLHRFLRPGEDEGEVASSFMGPGPWSIRHQLAAPGSCSILHPSNRVKRSNVMVNHILKIILRVEKEEGTMTTGRKKLYEIAIHTPVHILSCHCTSEWTSLPRYDEALGLAGAPLEDTMACPCRTRQQAKERTDSHTADTLLGRVTSLPTVASNSLNSLADRTRLHEQLISGLVSEVGEEPPTYERFETIYG